MAYGDIKDLTRTVSDKILCDKAFNIAKNLKYDEYQGVLASMVYKFFYKKTSGSGIKEYFKQGVRKINKNQLLQNLTKEMYVHFL